MYLCVNIDGIKQINFYLIRMDEVIATGCVKWPYTGDAYLGDGFVMEKYRRKGYWKHLYEARCRWIEDFCPVDYFYLFVNPDNPMRKVYERYGFETYEIDDKQAVTPDDDIWMRKKIEK